MTYDLEAFGGNSYLRRMKLSSFETLIMSLEAVIDSHEERNLGKERDYHMPNFNTYPTSGSLRVSHPNKTVFHGLKHMQ